MKHHRIAIKSLLVKRLAPLLHDGNAPFPPTVGSRHQKAWPPIKEARGFVIEVVEIFHKVRIFLDECCAAYSFNSGVGDERTEKAEEIVHFNPLLLDRSLLDPSFHRDLELRSGGVEVGPCQRIGGSLEHVMEDAILGPC